MAAGTAETRTFLETLFPQDKIPGVALIWRLEGKRSAWATSRTTIETVLEAAPKDCYLGVGLRSKSFGHHERGGSADVSALLGLVIDFDVRNPSRTEAQNERLPKTKEAVLNLLRSLDDFMPTLVVDSGHGLQPWWVFDEPWQLTTTEDRADALRTTRGWEVHIRQLAAEKGWDIDSVYDLARVMRIPGTTNCKFEPPVRVKLIKSMTTGKRFHPEDFEEYAQEATPSASLVTYEVGKLKLDPNANPPLDKLTLLLENSEMFAKTWRGERKDLGTGSCSEFDLSLANQAASAGWEPQEIVDLLLAFRRDIRKEPPKTDAKGALRMDYYYATVTKALAGNKAERILSTSEDGGEIPKEGRPRREVIDSLAVAFEVPLNNIEHYDGEGAFFRFILSNGTAEIKAEQLLDQQTWRRRIFGCTGNVPKSIGKKHNPTWDEFAKIIYEVSEKIKLGQGATRDGTTAWMLREYFQARPPVEIERGTLIDNPEHPFVKDATVWFRPELLFGFITRPPYNFGIKTFPELLQRLRVIDCTRKTHSVQVEGKRTSMSFWGTPASILASPEEDDLDLVEDLQGGEEQDGA